MSKPKIKVEVFKAVKEWKVQFSFGVQSFTLKYGGTKAEANWMAKMLKECFANYTYKVLFNKLNQ